MMNFQRLSVSALAAVSLAFAVPFAAADVVVGDSMRDVIVELGSPSGEMSMGERVIWMYSNGTIQFVDGKAVQVDLTLPTGI